MSLCLALAFSHGSDDNWYVIRVRSDTLSHLLQGACVHANKATPAVPALCLDHFLPDATIAFCCDPNPMVSTPCPRSVDRMLLCSSLSNKILISAPLLLQCVLQKKNQYSARQRSSCRQEKVICYPNTDTQGPGTFREREVLKGNLGKDRGKGAGENPPNKYKETNRA